jgi:hypothetical protein
MARELYDDPLDILMPARLARLPSPLEETKDEIPPDEEESFINISALEVYSFGRNDLFAGNTNEVIDNVKLKTIPINVIVIITHFRAINIFSISIRLISFS